MLDDTIHEQDVRAQVHACVRFLIECCDGAHSLDQAGYNRVDAAFGRELAETEHLTLAQVVVGARMIRKYYRQLEASGLHTPMPKEVDAYLETQIAQAGKSEQPGIPVLPRGEKGANRVYLHQDRIVVVFPFDQSKLDALAPLKRVVDGWQFDYLKRKEWSYPKKATNLVIEALKPFRDFTYSKEITDLVAKIRCEGTLARELADLEEALLEREKQ